MQHKKTKKQPYRNALKKVTDLKKELLQEKTNLAKERDIIVRDKEKVQKALNDATRIKSHVMDEMRHYKPYHPDLYEINKKYPIECQSLSEVEFFRIYNPFMSIIHDSDNPYHSRYMVKIMASDTKHNKRMYAHCVSKDCLMDFPESIRYTLIQEMSKEIANDFWNALSSEFNLPSYKIQEPLPQYPYHMDYILDSLAKK